MTEKVALISHSDYEPAALRKAIKRSIDLSGFDLNQVAGKSVLLKPNVLGPFPPALGVTTHPEFLMQAILIFKEAGARVLVGDSPGAVHMPRHSFKVSGLSDVIEKTDVEFAQFEAKGSVEVNGMLIAKAALDADLIVNLPKFKTHSFTALTLSVKNMFGCMNGMLKAKCHRENIDRKSFSKAIVKVAEIVKPSLNIIDGIIGMDGNGPSAGRVKKLGVIVTGQNMFAVDAVCTRLTGIDPLNIETLAYANSAGLWNAQDEIDVVGDSIESLKFHFFVFPSTYGKNVLDWRISKFVLQKIWGGLSCQPKVIKNLCTKCFVCVKVCPVFAIVIREDNFPFVINTKCIQCFCCHENCPSQAIKIKQNLRARIGTWFTKRMTRK